MTRDGSTAPRVADHAVRAAVTTVLEGEGAGDAAVSVTFLSAAVMRDLNRRTFGRDRATDVIAYPMSHPGRVVGDIYVCPSVAKRAAGRHGVDEREELLRLVVHGTLHVLGYDHPDGLERQASPMWERQERYVAALRNEDR